MLVSWDGGHTTAHAGFSYAIGTCQLHPPVLFVVHQFTANSSTQVLPRRPCRSQKTTRNKPLMNRARCGMFNHRWSMNTAGPQRGSKRRERVDIPLVAASRQ